MGALLLGCSDGTTRIAYDIESAVAAFQQFSATSHVIRHAPRSFPEGCGGAYAVQFGANSTLVIWCKKRGSGEVASSYSTTYHLRFVKVPHTSKLDKAAGEPLHIDLAKENGAVVITSVR
jgi:hypothetical protein